MEIFGAHEVTAHTPAALRERLYVRTVDVTGSTNNDIKELAEAGEPEGAVIIADEQTAGKGRLGRSFWSPKNAGLYMSVLLRPTLAAADALSVTAAAAVSTAEAVDVLSGKNAGIKWVNDIYINGRKICGILAESAFDASGEIRYTVLGIGVNVADIGFPDDIKDKAGAVGADISIRPKLAAEILTRFFAYYDRLPSKSFMDEYRRRSVLTGKLIEYERGGVMYSGTVIGTDDDAKLIVRDEAGNVSLLSSGEVNIKSAVF